MSVKTDVLMFFVLFFPSIMLILKHGPFFASQQRTSPALGEDRNSDWA